MPRTSKADLAKQKEQHLAEFRQELALEKFREERPQLWIQFMRIKRLLAIQAQLPDETFPDGCCFLHGNFVSVQSFCIKRVTDIDLDTCQITVEVHGDDDLEEGHVLLPLESVEWYGFPARAVPTGVHIVGFDAGMHTPKDAVPASGAATPPPKTDGTGA